MPDVHNNTPILDIINLGDEARSLSALSLLESNNQTVILDLENCSRQSAVWRSLHQGHTSLTRSLLARTGEPSLTVSGARVEPVSQAQHRRVTCLVPALLAPLLSDSACSSNLHVSTARRRQAQVFSSHRSDHVVRQFLSPHVDRGEMLSGQVPGLVSTLVYSHTDHSCAGDSSVVDTNSLLPLMFGQLSAGLRQLAARAVVSTILLNCTPEQASKRLDKVCETQGFMLTQLFVKPSLSKPKQSSEASMSYEYEIELGNEMELSFRRRNPDDSDDDSVSEGIEISVSDKSSSNSPTEAASDLMDTIAKLDRELETIKTECELDSLDRDLANWESELLATLERIQTYHAELGSLDTVQLARRRSQELMEELRLQRRLLESSTRELEEVENSVASIDISGVRSEASERSRRMLDENWSLGAARFLPAEEEQDQGVGRVSLPEAEREENSGVVREHCETLVQTLTVAATYNDQSDGENEEPSPPGVGRIRIPFLRTPPLPHLVDSSSDWDTESENSSESDTWGGIFSLRHTRPSQPDSGSMSGISEANIVARLTARTLFALTDYLGIPHSLRPIFSVEAARLQIFLALHSHRSINCDRNCEGEASDTDDSETEDWLHTDSDTEDEPDIIPNLTDSDHSQTYDDDDQSSESSLSNFSQRSWYGSLSQLTEGRQLTPLSTPPALTQSEGDSDSEEESDMRLMASESWLDDREDFQRVRQFLEAGPGPDFTHSTDSESLSDIV